jgi:hypothetical protein
VGRRCRGSAGAVDDLDVEQLLERALLSRRQLVVGDETSKPVSLGRDGTALPLPTYQFGSTWRLCRSAPTTGAGGHRKVARLGERVLNRPAVVAARVDGDEKASRRGWRGR